jgi:glycine cleavage system H protein
MKYSESQTWVLVDGDCGTVGITESALKELGEVVFVELPKVDKTVNRGEEVAVLESTKAAADIYSPISGEILEVNTLIKEDLSLINRAPEKEGWLYKIRLSAPDELKQLMDRKSYIDMIS